VYFDLAPRSATLLADPLTDTLERSLASRQWLASERQHTSWLDCKSVLLLVKANPSSLSCLDQNYAYTIRVNHQSLGRAKLACISGRKDESMLDSLEILRVSWQQKITREFNFKGVFWRIEGICRPLSYFLRKQHTNDLIREDETYQRITALSVRRADAEDLPNSLSEVQHWIPFNLRAAPFSLLSFTS